MSFLLWRIFKKRIPTDDVLQIMGIPMVSKYYCCNNDVEKTQGTFINLTVHTAQKLWRHFVTCAGFKAGGRNLFITLNEWWGHVAGLRAKGILNAIPVIILWGFWKRRNAIKYGREMFDWKVLTECKKNL